MKLKFSDRRGAASLTLARVCPRPLLVGVLVVLAAAGAGGCGAGGPNRAQAPSSGAPAAGRSTSGTSAVGEGERDEDSDNDSLGVARSDPDNDAIPAYGPTAGPADRQAITELVTRYYAAAVAQNGARACALLHWLLAEELVELHAHGKGPAPLRGAGCAQIVTKLFRLHRRALIGGIAPLKVTTVQVRATHAWAVVDLGGAHKYIAFARREGAVWKLGAMLGYDQAV